MTTERGVIGDMDASEKIRFVVVALVGLALGVLIGSLVGGSLAGMAF